MRTKRIDAVSDKKEAEMLDYRNAPLKASERNGEMHLLIIAIDPENLMVNRSVTFQFDNKEEGMLAYHVLAATARNVQRARTGEGAGLHLVK